MTDGQSMSQIYHHVRSTLKTALSDPNLFAREVNRAYHRRLGMRDYNTDGTDIFQEDWDNLIILDACRLDTFEAYNTVAGNLQTRISRGSNTVEFLRGNIADRELWGTVYVTANPQLHNHRPMLSPEFHYVHDLWQEMWDSNHGTVLPETVTENALDVSERFPNKKLIIHYIQPHIPFIDSSVTFGEGSQTFDTDVDPWNLIMKGEANISKEELQNASVSNLQRALPHVERVVDELPGKTVVTSDHGQCFGDRSSPLPIQEWGHPWGMYIEPLVKVPWLICNRGSRKEIVPEPPVEERRGNKNDVVTDRLKDLGYV